MKFPNIIVVAGSYPDVGKGIFSASLGYLLKTYGFSVQMLKFDGYMNISSGSMNPYHKKMDLAYSEEEVFVLEDGYEADADSGYYERFMHEPFYSNSNITNGQLFKDMIELDTAGDILNYRAMRGSLKKRVLNEKFKNKDFLVIEIGGTVGDKESEIMYDTLNLIRQQEGCKIFTVMLAPCFYQKSALNTELSYRTKNIRQAYEKMWRLGLAPQAIVLRQRDNLSLEKQDLEYVALETGLSTAAVFIDKDSESIYDLPFNLRSQKMPEYIINYFNLSSKGDNERYIEEYSKLLKEINKKAYTKIAVFGKTMSCDTYVSILEAIEHASVKNGLNLRVVWLDDQDDWKNAICDCSGLLIGEGLTHVDDKIKAIKYAYKNDIPTLAISFGMILMMKALANIRVEELGETFYDIESEEDLFVGNINGERVRMLSLPKTNIQATLDKYFECKMAGDLVFEIVGKNKGFFVGTIYHPEFKSYPIFPHRKFDELVRKMKNVR